MLTKIDSENMPLLNLLGRRTIRGLLIAAAGSGGVEVCLDRGEGDNGVPFGDGDLG